VVNLLGNTIWTIGRGKENDIVLKDPLVSRQHAMLQTITFNDVYLIYFADLESRNGSWINRYPIQRQQLLAHGDQITLGHATLKFYYPESTKLEDLQITLP
jgi:adenylate cyclase